MILIPNGMWLILRKNDRAAEGFDTAPWHKMRNMAQLIMYSIPSSRCCLTFSAAANGMGGVP